MRSNSRTQASAQGRLRLWEGAEKIIAAETAFLGNNVGQGWWWVESKLGSRRSLGAGVTRNPNL